MFNKGDKFSVLCLSSYSDPKPVIEWTIVREEGEDIWMDYYYPACGATGKNRSYTKTQVRLYMPKKWKLLSYTEFEILPEELFNVD